MKASGRETIRSFQQSDADTANKETPLELIQQGDQIIVRTNQDRVSDRTRVTSDLELTVPIGSSIEAHGRQGDFDIQNVSGAVDINSDNAGVRLENIGGDVRIDLRKGTADILLSKAELAERRAALEKRGGYKYPASQTPWQEIQRGMVDQLADGMVLKPAVKYQRVAERMGIPRDNH